MKNELYKEMYSQYLKGYSLSELGKMFGMTRQSVYSGFNRREFQMRTKKELPFQSFNSKRFTKKNNGYLAKTDGSRDLMHRVVWEFYNGVIPSGHDIHHINKNKEDNRIENLELYTKSEHASKFSSGNNQYKK